MTAIGLRRVHARRGAIRFAPYRFLLFPLSETPLMRFLRIVPFLAVLAVILVFGLKPEPVPQSFDQQDKLHHLLGFAAFAFTLRFAWPSGRLRWALLLSLAVALLIEVAQGYQPHRVASLGDMFANAAGVLLGIGCAALLAYRSRNGQAAKAVASAEASRPV